MDWGHCKEHINSPILTNSRVDVVGFVDFHKVIVQMSATSAFPSAWNEGESKDGVESEKLKRQPSQVERRFGFTKNP
jgi:hypothetical protein